MRPRPTVTIFHVMPLVFSSTTDEDALPCPSLPACCTVPPNSSSHQSCVWQGGVCFCPWGVSASLTVLVSKWDESGLGGAVLLLGDASLRTACCVSFGESHKGVGALLLPLRLYRGRVDLGWIMWIPPIGIRRLSVLLDCCECRGRWLRRLMAPRSRGGCTVMWARLASSLNWNNKETCDVKKLTMGRAAYEEGENFFHCKNFEFYKSV